MSCVSGSTVGQSGSLVLCNCMFPGSTPGGMLAFFLLQCAGLPPSLLKSMSPMPFNFYIYLKNICEIVCLSALYLFAND